MHLFRRFIATPCLAPEDGAMSGGADPGGAGDGGTEPQYDADVATGDADAGDAEGIDAGAGARDEDEDLDLLVTDDDPADGRTLEERFEALRKANNKLKRRNLKHRTIAERLKGVDLDSVLEGAKQFTALQQRVRGNPKLLAQIMGMAATEEGGEDDGEQPSARSTGRGNGRSREPVIDFDAAKIPFRAEENETNEFFHDEIRRNRTVEAYVREHHAIVGRLEKRIEQLEGGIHQDRETRVAETWKGALDSALRLIKDPDDKVLFQDIIAAAYKQAPRANPNAIIDHYKKLKAFKPYFAQQRARIATAADAQRMAQRNAQLPRHQAGGPGAPSPAKSRKETITDVTRRIRASVR